MKNITLRSQVGRDGQLRLNIPTTVTNMELEVIIWLRPVNPSNQLPQESFSKWWAKQLAAMPSQPDNTGPDLRFEYLAERYHL